VEGFRSPLFRSVAWVHISTILSRFPCPLHSFRTVGFPQYGWKQVFPGQSFRSRRLIYPSHSGLRPVCLFQAWVAAFAAIADSRIPSCQLAHRSFARQQVILSFRLNRYYDLMRQSLRLRCAWSLDCSQRSCRLYGLSHLPFFALIDLHSLPLPIPRRSSRSLLMILRPRNRSHRCPICSLAFGFVPLETGSCGGSLRGSSFHLMLRPTVLLGHLARPRFRISLPPSESPLSVYSRACPQRSLLLHESAMTTRLHHQLPRQDFHPLVYQRTKAAQLD
jgi:hypothetical protein